MRRYSAHAGLLIVEAKAYCPGAGAPTMENQEAAHRLQSELFMVTTGVQVGALSDGESLKFPHHQR